MKLLNARCAFGALLVPLVVSCGPRLPKASDALPVEQMRVVFQQAFQSADGATRDLVSKLVDESEQRHFAVAYTDVNELLAMRNLTPQQSITVVRAANTLGQLVTDAAQNGDQQSADAMRAAQRAH